MWYPRGKIAAGEVAVSKLTDAWARLLDKAAGAAGSASLNDI
jgi:hypothetical protein